MPRANRHFLPGYVWHITHRCHRKSFLLKFARDRRAYLHWLFEAKKRFGVSVLNYTVTCNHVHLLVKDTGPGIIANSIQLIAGRTGLSLQSLPSQARPSTPELGVNAHGFSLHAAVRWRADQHKELEQLCRYITRPAIANERLKRNRAGQVVLQLKSPYKDGTTHIVMEPLEFMERLAALVPRPRLHLIRFHGVLAPNAKLRSKIVPAPPERATEPPDEHAHAQGAPARMSWARLLKRVFDIDWNTAPTAAAL